MRKSVIFILFYLLLLGLLAYAADNSQKLLDIMVLVDEKKYPEAIAGYENFLKDVPESLRGAIQFEIATLHAAVGNKGGALTILQQAVDSGFDDCLSVEQYDEWKAIRSDPRFSSLQSRMKISEADLKEIYWLKDEVEHIDHDTKLMIIENTNRLDTGITQIYQSTIPDRTTTSTGVLFHRELIKMMHLAQRQYVTQSDRARMEHVGSMTVISGQTTAEQVLESLRRADQAADQRMTAINARQFTLPRGIGTTPRSCPEWKK